MKNNDLDEFISNIKLNILFSEPLLGYIISKINIVMDNEIETLLIYFNSDIFMYEIKYNYNFLISLNDLKEVNAVFKHELYHLIYKHHYRAISFQKKYGFLDMKTANIAMDISINQHIENLPSLALSYEDYDLEKGLDFETYYILIYKNNHGGEEGEEEGTGNESSNSSGVSNDDSNKGESQSNDENDKGEGSETDENENGFASTNSISKKISNKKKESMVENHNELLKSVLTEDKDIIENLTDKIILEGIKNTHSKYGSGDFLDNIKNLIKKKSIVSWKKVVKQFVEKTVVSGDTKSTWLKENRRFDYLKGKIKLKEAQILIAVDTSGSISNEVIFKFLNELEHISSNEMLKIVYFNSIIYNEIDNIKKEKKKLYNIQRGGTLFQPVFDYAKKNKYKNVIMMTDGYGESSLKLYNIKSIFINNNLKEIYMPKIKEIKSNMIFNNYKTIKVSI